MKAIRGFLAALSGAAMPAAAAILVIGLAAQAVRAHQDNVRHVRRAESLEAQAGKLRRENDCLRAEAAAIRQDPAYVENLLRQAKMGSEGEKLLVR